MCFETLVRNILNLNEDVALVMLGLTTYILRRASAQHWQAAIAEAYNVPFVSWADAIWPMHEASNGPFEGITRDEFENVSCLYMKMHVCMACLPSKVSSLTSS